MAVATAITAARKRLAAAWSIAKTSSSAPETETLRRLNQPDRQAGIAFASSFYPRYNESDVVCPALRVFRPNEPGPSMRMSGSAHRLANLDALSPMRSCRLPSSIDGIEAE